MRAVSRSPSGPSNRHSSTPVAFSENRAKLTPAPSHVAPSGYGDPGRVFISLFSSKVDTIGRSLFAPGLAHHGRVINCSMLSRRVVVFAVLAVASVLAIGLSAPAAESPVAKLSHHLHRGFRNTDPEYAFTMGGRAARMLARTLE